MQKYCYTILFLLVSLISFGQQTQEQLEQKKAQLQEEIREKELLLQEVRKKEKSAVKLLEIQKDKIGLKEKLIHTTAKQTKLLSDDIYTNQLQINQLKKELVVLKEDYAAMILKSYKSRSQQSRAMFLLSSENFTQAYKRLQYMKQYANYRKMQVEEIKVKTKKLDDYNQTLSGQKTEKEKLLSEQEKQKQDLVKEKALNFRAFLCKGNIFVENNTNNEDLESWYGNAPFFNVYSQGENKETFIDPFNDKRPDFRLNIGKITASKND